ncbi:hypothetical protein GGR56DRAFT_343264 [Xylariaceae sp. FL0804]|nr:hypothetical protein GGR56DRAFT_343264 [Xylariaceae sp. FL0804]
MARHGKTKYYLAMCSVLLPLLSTSAQGPRLSFLGHTTHNKNLPSRAQERSARLVVTALHGSTARPQTPHTTPQKPSRCAVPSSTQPAPAPHMPISIPPLSVVAFTPPFVLRLVLRFFVPVLFACRTARPPLGHSPSRVRTVPVSSSQSVSQSVSRPSNHPLPQPISPEGLTGKKRQGRE